MGAHQTIAVYSPLQLLIRYFRHRRRAANGKGHGTHSPFVYDFIRTVLTNGNGYGKPEAVHALRSRLRGDNTPLHIVELGAGSRSGAGSFRRVKDILRTSVKPARFGDLMFRLARRYRPATVLELGTSLGLTTACMASGAPDAAVHTIEGSPDVARLAARHLEALGLSGATVHTGPFDEVLPRLLPSLRRIDLAYLDGNHRYAPTVQYWAGLQPHLHTGSVVVLDDIHWSPEMERAWEEVRRHPSVRCSVDIFYLGFLFFDPSFREVQHFSIRF